MALDPRRVAHHLRGAGFSASRSPPEWHLMLGDSLVFLESTWSGSVYPRTTRYASARCAARGFSCGFQIQCMDRTVHSNVKTISDLEHSKHGSSAFRAGTRRSLRSDEKFSGSFQGWTTDTESHGSRPEEGSQHEGLPPWQTLRPDTRDTSYHPEQYAT